MNNKGADQTEQADLRLLFAYGKNRFSHYEAHFMVAAVAQSLYIV